MPDERRSSRFCCTGCEAVHLLLDQEGLLRFYDLGGGRDGAVGPVPRTVVAADWLPELEARGRDASGGVRLHLDVQGIRCAACVWLLQEVWRRLPGARSIRIDPSLGQVTLAYEQAHDTARAFLERSSRLGYPMAPASRVAQQDTGLLVRLGICVAIAMNAMILAVSSYFGLEDGPLVPLFRNVLLGLATISVVVGGPVFFRAAWAGLRAGMVHMDLPISLGLALAYGGSLWLHAHGADAYFDTVAIFIAFMLGGRFLQQRTLRKNRDQVLADDGAEHMRARRLAGDRIEVVPIAALRQGDELLLAPGDLLPVRATVVGTGASFSLDWISGESEPRTFGQGNEVPAGAFFGGRSAVRMRAVSDYLGSGLAELLRRPPDERENGRGKVRFWHLLAKHYSLGVLLAAALGALAWAFVDPSRSLPVAISVLVITCPCAMGIATPLAFHLALALLRRRGVFVRSAALLDKTRFLRKVVFDKTGTLTFGGVRALEVMAPSDADQAALATMVASSNHPVSQAVLATVVAPRFLADVHVREVPGQGLEAEVDGRVWRLGSRKFCGLPAVTGDDGPECALACNGVERARWRLQEDFRSGAATEIADLQRRGLQVHILSGDKPERVARAAALLGIEPALATGGMSPDGKAAYVRELDRADTLMLGDGINDAPAFAAAFCAGTPAMDRPVLPARADFFFRGAEAGAVSAVLDIAALQQRVVRVNLALALLYNGSTLVACLLDLMTPGLTAVLMPISSAALVLHTSVRFARARRRLP